MEKAKKNLKVLSIVILIFAGLTLLSLCVELLPDDFSGAEIPEGSPENIVLITKIFLMTLTVIMLLPQIYIGIKGIKMAKNPDSSKAHIVWAIILLAFSVIAIISPLVAIFKQEAVKENVSDLCNILVEAIMFFEYIVYARAVAKGE